MKFRLYYRGSLKSNGKPNEKHNLRMHFHSQLEDLWKRLPLSEQSKDFLNLDYELSAIKKVSDVNYAAVVNSNNHLVAELDILMLRPEEPGSVVTQGGDIDNRLKTLLDALTIPKPDQVVSDKVCIDRINHCLLEDDNLVTGLNVKVDRLLGSNDPSEVILIIAISVTATRGTFANLAICVNGNS
jgi:hypothetical protein